MTPLQKITHLVLTAALVVFVFGRIFQQDIYIQPDSSRYMKMGLQVAEAFLPEEDWTFEYASDLLAYGEGGPFSALEVGMAATFSDNTRHSLQCFVQAKSLINDCVMDIDVLLFAYGLELLIFHACVGLIAYLVLGSSLKAWLAVAVSLGFKETRIYSTSVLTEPSYMMWGGLFMLAWVYCWKNPNVLKSWLICGIALGFVILVKPSWQALLPALWVLALLHVAYYRAQTALVLKPLALLSLGAFLVFGPLIVRNGLSIGVWNLTPPGYLPASLAHRFGFNDMSWLEWAAGWIYYLPDFGDNWARSFFGAETVAKLHLDAGSYYAYGRDILHKEAMAAAPDGQVVRYLLSEHFFNDTPKSIAVTAMLMWRGIFVGSLMGLAALLLAGPVLYFMNAQTRKLFALIVLPLLIMVGVHALVSVSILRYNLILIVPYAIILAQVFFVLSNRAVRYLPAGFRAKANTFFPKNG